MPANISENTFKFGTGNPLTTAATPTTTMKDDPPGLDWGAWAAKYHADRAGIAAAAAVSTESFFEMATDIKGPTATDARIAGVTAEVVTPAVANDTSKFEPFATYWDDDLDKVPPPPAGSPPAVHLISSGLQPQSPPGPPPSYIPQQQLVTDKIHADTPMTVATALQPRSTTASFLDPLDDRDIFHMEITESPKHAPTHVVTAPTKATARMIKRWQRNPATVA